MGLSEKEISRLQEKTAENEKKEIEKIHNRKEKRLLKSKKYRNKLKRRNERLAQIKK